MNQPFYLTRHEQLSEKTKPVGGLWLIKHYANDNPPPLYITSSIGKSRRCITDGDFVHQIYSKQLAIEDTVIAHIQFHLKQEIVSLELLARVFKQIDALQIITWLKNTPTSQFARRAAFLYEWLTAKTLDIDMTIVGNYVDVLDADQVVTASQSVRNSKWRVNNNIAGNRLFSPLIFKTSYINNLKKFDIKNKLAALNQQYGEDLLMRASAWITLRESRSSFAIEGESKHLDRIERFAQVMANRVGRGEMPFSNQALGELQQAIIGKSLTIKSFGLRKSPVFVGESNYRERKEVVHYIAPPHKNLNERLAGLEQFLHSTMGQSSLIRSAVAAFGFVYIHPLADGNGRVHRLLINDILRRDGEVAEPIILPISKAIIEDGASRKAYNTLLDTVSARVMQSLTSCYSFGDNVVYDDGVHSNLVLSGDDNAEPIWRYMDLTPHVAYLSDLINKVIDEDMAEESAYLQRHDNMRHGIKNVIEMSNYDADRIIRSILDNQGVRSHKLAKEYELLNDDELWTRLVAVVKQFAQLS
ncbi:Fic family protein [Moraxella marmotae]|uniref:Fic family protein n=1 Tax=Moraxella marmotae TaxID=3344520 RepID=UPI0035F3E115